MGKERGKERGLDPLSPLSYMKRKRKEREEGSLLLFPFFFGPMVKSHSPKKKGKKKETWFLFLFSFFFVIPLSLKKERVIVRERTSLSFRE